MLHPSENVSTRHTAKEKAWNPVCERILKQPFDQVAHVTMNENKGGKRARLVPVAASICGVGRLSDVYF